MSSFERLHPALQHHIVNSLGWRDLRPFQQAVIEPALSARHLLILAPTAGGKTEAAFFPVLSRMLTDDWRNLSVLYVCPIKALLNNLDARLARYCSLVGRRSALWHGDIPAGQKKAILREPPDCLLTTPESLEVLLVSQKSEARAFFAQLQVVIVDEIHAFAGDDRGVHLLGVLSRIQRLCGREFQRIGLSATVGNPEDLLEWLAGACAGERQVCIPPPTPATEAEVKLDHVGSLANAAVVISRLHRGEKRLVFVDSRSRAEELGRQLRSLEVATFVTHSSLSQDERRQAEEAFAGRDDCVIVATSVLELGIDVGDLHRVIQIDAPASVARHKGRATDIMNNIRAVATQVRLGNIPMGHVADHLHDWVSDERVLWAAWTYLKQNGGHAAGPDGMRYCDFIDRQAWAECRDLRDEIRAGTYRPGDERVQLIPKASGNGTRPLVIQNLRDRVVQRAVVEVVQPFLDPLFDPRSFGFRPMRGIQDALVLAEHLYVTEQRRVWVTQDLKNAFLKVPLERILDLVRKYLGSEEMTEFIRTVLSGARTPGLRQGGPLSPLLLNVYLHVVLDCRWRQLHPDIPLLRFADDLLLMCRSQAEAERAHADLAELLRPTKMKLKFKVEEATRTLTADQAAEWLGFRIEDGPEGLRIMLAEDALDNLAVNLDDAHHKANAPLRAIKSVEGWLAAMAPCYPFVNRAVVCEQIAEIAGAAAFDEVPGPQELQACWQRAYARWRKMKKKLKRRLLSVDASPVEAHVASDPQNAHTDQEHDDGFIQVERREDGFCQMME